MSVVVPTFRRPELLRRAVESVRAQTFAGWELIISDDEETAGEGWREAEGAAAADGRVRAVRNPGARGQAGNLNFAMSLARGEWIKPLYDDDVLEPACLERMLAAAALRERAGGAAIVRCLADRYRDGELRSAACTEGLAWAEYLGGAAARAALHREDAEIGMPTQVLVRASVVRGGVRMQDEFEGMRFVSCSDWWWFVRLLEAGGLVLVNEVLCQEHQGDRPSVTAGLDRDELYDEIARMRVALRVRMEARGEGAGLASSAATTCLTDVLRCGSHARAGRWGRALAAAWRARHPGGWVLAARWALRRRRPSRWRAVARTVLAERAPGAAVQAEKARARRESLGGSRAAARACQE